MLGPEREDLGRGMGAACPTGCLQQGLAGLRGPTTLAEDSLWPALHQPSGQMMTKTARRL